ncbi:hypothetical protein Bca101_019976 [Brassica carinata]
MSAREVWKQDLPSVSSLEQSSSGRCGGVREKDIDVFRSNASLLVDCRPFVRDSPGFGVVFIQLPAM